MKDNIESYFGDDHSTRIYLDKPGTELDALIHKHVMGKETCECETRHSCGGMCIECGEEMPWGYSDNITAAWGVVEKMLTEHSVVDIDVRSDNTIVSIETCNSCEYIMSAPTAPHAICLAALKAVVGHNGN